MTTSLGAPSEELWRRFSVHPEDINEWRDMTPEDDSGDGI